MGLRTQTQIRSCGLCSQAKQRTGQSISRSGELDSAKDAFFLALGRVILLPLCTGTEGWLKTRRYSKFMLADGILNYGASNFGGEGAEEQERAPEPDEVGFLSYLTTT